jgi:hypothetical protein
MEPIDFSNWTVIRDNADGTASVVEVYADSEGGYEEKVVETYNLWKDEE